MLTANIWRNAPLRPCRVRRTAGSADNRASGTGARHDRGTSPVLGNPGRFTRHPNRPHIQILKISTRTVGNRGTDRLTQIGRAR